MKSACNGRMEIYMSEFTINEMKEMQKILQEKYKDKWEGISAEVGQNNYYGWLEKLAK